jgi:hypothetical protein
VVVIANRRNTAAELLGGFEDRRTRRHGDSIAIDSERYISHTIQTFYQSAKGIGQAV